MPRGHACKDGGHIQALGGTTRQCTGCGTMWEWDGHETTGVRPSETNDPKDPPTALQVRRAEQKGGLTATETLSAGKPKKKAAKKAAK